jgi:hypothetical protein
VLDRAERVPTAMARFGWRMARGAARRRPRPRAAA